MNTDASGHLFDTLLDAASIGHSTYKLIRNPSWENAGYLAWDVGAAFVPFVPGSYVAKGAKVAIKASNKRKAINLPSYKKIKLDIEHILSGHTKTGSRAKQSRIKDLFPDNMSESQIKKAILNAYKNAKKIKTQGNRVLLRGRSNGLTIEMWLNLKTKTIETAYPIRR